MRGFTRKDGLFSLCGLNCGLCSMKIGGWCPGCGCGEEQHSCKLARCSLEHGGVEYCFQCGAFPCKNYLRIDEFDSFITHRNQLLDIQKAQELGLSAYHAEQAEKTAVLETLLCSFNDGRKKSLFCAAVNLLDLTVLREIMAQLCAQQEELALKERSALAAQLLRNAAEERGISLKLRKKT